MGELVIEGVMSKPRSSVVYSMIINNTCKSSKMKDRRKKRDKEKIDFQKEWESNGRKFK